jgi:hypothetical protein
MRATPIQEIQLLQRKPRVFSSLTVPEVNRALKAGTGPIDVRLKVNLAKGDELTLGYQGNTIAAISSAELENGRGSLDVLIDKGVAEIFVDGGARYIVREIPTTPSASVEFGLQDNARAIDRLEIFPMKSMWATAESSER